MANDDAGGEDSSVDESARRRTTYTPPVRRFSSDQQSIDDATNAGEEPQSGSRAEASGSGSSDTDHAATVAHHGSHVADQRQDVQPGPRRAHVNDDELAHALEQEVSRYSNPAATPPGGSHPAHAENTPLAALSDDEVASLIGADMDSTGDTLGAIAKLQQVLAVRENTTSIPVIQPSATTDERAPDFAGWIAPAAFLAEPTLDENEPTAVPSDEFPTPSPIAAPIDGDLQARDELAATDAPADGPATLPDPAAAVGDATAPLTTASVPISVMHLTPTGSQDVIGQGFDTDIDDDADDVAVSFEDVLAPKSSPRVSNDEDVLFDAQALRRPIFTIEQPALEPTPLDYRIGRASRMFWLWFATTSSLVSLGIGASMYALGLSVRQLVLATIVGIALSFLPLGLGTLAGKWSGQPTMVVSRATFGVVGNIVPAILAVVTRLFWGAVLLWLVGTATGAVAVHAGWSVTAVVPSWIGVGVALVVAIVIAFFGYSFIARVQLILTIASAVAVIGTIAYTAPSVNVAVALAKPDGGGWLRVLEAAIIVFSFLGLAWANSSGDLARYQRPASSGTASMTWATFGAALPPFILISYGGLISASNPSVARGLLAHPVQTLAGLGLPSWYPVPLLLAVVLSLISSIIVNIYSGGFALQAVGVSLPRQFSAGIIGICVALGAALLLLNVPNFGALLTSLPATLAVPVAAWAGIFAAEMMIRKRRFNPESLLRRGGVYPDWRWVNLAGLVVASVLGLGLIHSNLGWLRWEGFLMPALGVAPGSALAVTNLGVVVALVLGLLTPVIFGIRAVRAQERATR
jgi:nucleobase:cation symporter-1, NCS1 family